jgi:hypothetical protein
VKPYFAAFCMVVAWSTVCFSQSPAERDLYEKLAKADGKSLETVLKTPEEYSALVLYVGAGVALKEKKLEDSAFFFYTGQLRARFDQKCFPSKESGGDSPFLFYAALSQGLGIAINPAVMAEPKIFAKAIERVEKWNPKAPEAYTPGYEFKERLSEKDAHEAAKPNRTEFLRRMGDLSKLLNDAEYFAAFRVGQAYNLAIDDKRPTKEENEMATETMKRIEKERGLKGFFSK